jgi:hypothetical protein
MAAICYLITALLKTPWFNKVLNVLVSKDWTLSKKQKIIMAFLIAVLVSYFMWHDRGWWKVLWKAFQLSLMAMGLRSLKKHWWENGKNGGEQVKCKACDYWNLPGVENCENCKGSLKEVPPKPVRCKKCGFMNSPAAESCEQCSSPLKEESEEIDKSKYECPKCKTSNDVKEMNCKHCGAKQVK